ncbi:MAG: hypothetical protein ACXWK6_05680 [Myxococcaceae bacterium]
MSGGSEWFRTAFRRSQASSLDEPCPTPEELWALTRGELARARSSPIILHSSRCARCGAALRIGLEMAEQLDGAAAGPKIIPLRRFSLGLGLAAAIAATVLIVPYVRSPKSEIHERGGVPDEVRSLVPSTPRSRAGLVLEWSPYPDAVRYQVTLASRDLHVLFQKVGLNGTRVEVPEAALATVPSGARLIWHVEAILADGRAIKSPAFDLVVE